MMSHIERPDGARIYYEVQGEGYPLLLFAPGAINSQVSFWGRSAINPYDFANEYMIIGMNQRHAEKSPAPLAAPTWEMHAADQRAVLDAVGVERCHLWGGCIGVAYNLKFIQENPGRVTAAVCQDVVGLVAGVNTRATFFAMFEPTVEAARRGGMAAVVAAALENPTFMANNTAGPFAARIASDERFRDEVLALDPTEYERIIRAYDDQMWGAHGAYMSVEEAFVRECLAPLLVLPGRDEFHPTELAQRLCREAPRATCLAPDCRSPEKIEATKETIRRFLREHTPRA
jgi:pimeloyl-ACP methyl ester carboxylesterase